MRTSAIVIILVLSAMTVMLRQGYATQTKVANIQHSFDSLTQVMEYNLIGEYQLTVNQDSIFIWDKDRYVGRVLLGEDSLSNIILKDNE